MDRITGSTAVSNMFGAGKGGFTGSNPAQQNPATIVTADWLNGVQEEIMRVIEAAGLSGNNADNTLLSQAIQIFCARTAVPAVPAGTIIYFAGSNPPNGYMKANGGLRSRTAYATLFAAIGTTYGAGDGATTFGIPDLRGEFIRSWDDDRGVDAGRVLGSAQSGTHITGDNDDNPSIHGIGHIDECNIDKPDGIARSVSLGGVQSTTVMAGYWGMTRPRNVALLACIKF